jgi:hypothetical protein
MAPAALPAMSFSLMAGADESRHNIRLMDS